MSDEDELSKFCVECPIVFVPIAFNIMNKGMHEVIWRFDNEMKAMLMIPVSFLLLLLLFLIPKSFGLAWPLNIDSSWNIFCSYLKYISAYYGKYYKKYK